MATAIQLITEAMEENHSIALGETPEGVEAQRGLTRLQAMFRAAVEGGVFGRVDDYYASTAYTALEGQRIFSSGFTITLPLTYPDYNNGNTRKPYDLSQIQVVNTGSVPQISIYDASTAAWVRVDNLSLAGEVPLSERYRHGMVTALSRAMSPLAMANVSDVTMAYAAMFSSILSNRLGAPATVTKAQYF